MCINDAEMFYKTFSFLECIFNKMKRMFTGLQEQQVSKTMKVSQELSFAEIWSNQENVFGTTNSCFDIIWAISLPTQANGLMLRRNKGINFDKRKYALYFTMSKTGQITEIFQAKLVHG